MRLLASRNYRYWAAADLVSVTGTWMQVLGVNWFVLQETGSATHMGLTVMLHALPVLLLGPYGGALADRLPVRRLLLLTQAAHAALAVARGALVLAGAVGVLTCSGAALWFWATASAAVRVVPEPVLA